MGKKVLLEKKFIHVIAVLVFFVLFIASTWIIGFYADAVENYDNEKLPDLRFGYSFDDVNKYFGSLSEDGKHYYLNSYYFADTIYSIIYTTFNILALSFLINNCFGKNRKFFAILSFPIISYIADSCENFFVRSFFVDPDNVNKTGVIMAGTFTMIKFISVYISFGLIILLLIRFIFTVIKAKGGKNVQNN